MLHSKSSSFVKQTLSLTLVLVASLGGLAFLGGTGEESEFSGSQSLLGGELARPSPMAMLLSPLAGFQEADASAILGPLRVVRDPYSAFSAVAVDTVRDEVVATDENNFQILVYDRTENTPPSAAMSEPKRVISGPQTYVEFQCGLYIDQQNGDIYAVNNDTADKLVIFSRQAEGDVPPDRWLTTPHGTFGIAVDERHQELFLTVQHDSAVVVYEKMASGDDAPIRMLQGDRTKLADPHGIAIDPNRDLIYVANFGSTHDVEASAEEIAKLKPNWPLMQEYAVPGSGRFYLPSITIYSRTASGNSAPVGIIQGAKTQLNWPTSIAFHPQRNELYVTNDMTDSILIFDGDARGNAAPIRVLGGPNSRIDNPTGIYLDLENKEMWVASFGNHALSVFDVDAEGDASPLRVIRSAPLDQPSLMIGNPGAVAYDPTREQILVPN